MTYEEIVEALGYAAAHEHRVRITTLDKTEVIGVPTSVDHHVASHEVYLKPVGLEDTEVAVSLGQVASVELLEG